MANNFCCIIMSLLKACESDIKRTYTKYQYCQSVLRRGVLEVALFNMYSFVLPGDNTLKWHISHRVFCSLLQWVSVLCSRWGYTTRAQWQQGNLRNRKHLSTLVIVVLGAHTRNISHWASPRSSRCSLGGRRPLRSLSLSPWRVPEPEFWDQPVGHMRGKGAFRG